MNVQLTINACLLLFLLRNPRFPISFELSRSFRVSSATEFSLRFSLSVSFPLEFSFFPVRLVFSFSARSGVTFPARPELTFSTGFEFSFPTRFIFFSFPELRRLFSFRLFLFFSCFFLTLELLVFSVKDFIFAEFTFQWPVIAKIADKVPGVFVPVVISIALITFIGWLIAGENVGSALSYGIAVLVISCPCALGLATPVAIMVGNGVGAKNGILFKTAASLEAAGKIQIVALDKTGTITAGEPDVTDIIPVAAKDANELLEIAYTLERKSEHPLAKAVLKKAEELNMSPREVTDFAAVAGNGLSAKSGGQVLVGGNYKFISEQISVSDTVKDRCDKLASEGKTPMFFGRGSELMGIIAVADVIKEDSPKAVLELKNMGVHVVMLTGDNERTAKAIGRQAGVDEVVAGVLPDGKEEVIRVLKEHGKVAMVGDGINDAPALTRADIGIAIGAGTDVAIDAADIVLMKNRLIDVPAAIRMSRAALHNIHENLFWAFFYNMIGIPLAAGLFVTFTGWKLNPMFGAAAMSLSSVCVVTNALRLNLFKLYDAGKDKKNRKNKKRISVSIISGDAVNDKQFGK